MEKSESSNKDPKRSYKRYVYLSNFLSFKEETEAKIARIQKILYLFGTLILVLAGILIFQQ